MNIVGIAFAVAIFFISVVPAQQPVADLSESRALENLIRKNGGWSTSTSQVLIQSVRIEECKLELKWASVIRVNRWVETTFQDETAVVAAKTSPAFMTSLTTVSLDLREVDLEAVSLGKGPLQNTDSIKLPIKGKQELVLITEHSHSGKIFSLNRTQATIILKENVSDQAKSLFTNVIRRCQADS